MMKRLIAVLLLLCLLPTLPVLAEEEAAEPIVIPRGENGENQLIVPEGFDDNALPTPLGPVYEDKTLKDFDQNSPALYTCKITEDTSGYTDRSIYATRVFRTVHPGEKGEVLHIDPMWVVMRYKGQLAYVKRHRIHTVEPVDPATTAPYGVQKPQYVATTASTAEVHVSMSHDDQCWVVLNPGTKLTIWKIVDGWAVVVYWRTYA